MARPKTFTRTLACPALCDVCLRSCVTLDQAGIPCFFCPTGVFMHRRFWDFALCACGGAWDCKECHGRGVIGRPSEDSRLMDELPAEWASLGDRYRGGPVPAVVAERIRWAALYEPLIPRL